MQSTSSDSGIHDNGARDKLRDSIDLRKSRLTELAAAKAEAGKAHVATLVEITDACRRIAVPCILPRSKTEDARFAEDMHHLSAEEVEIQRDLAQLQMELKARDDVAKNDSGRKLVLIDDARQLVAAKEKALRKAAHENQIYRFASIWYGIDVQNVTDSQLAAVRGFFCLFSAVIISFAATLAAMVYYLKEKARGATRKSKLARLQVVVRPPAQAGPQGGENRDGAGQGGSTKGGSGRGPCRGDQIRPIQQPCRHRNAASTQPNYPRFVASEQIVMPHIQAPAFYSDVPSHGSTSPGARAPMAP